MLHARNVKTSAPLGRILRLLQNRGDRGATSREIMVKCDAVAPGTCASELRRNGYRVGCKFERTTDEGRKVYRYKLA